MEGYLTNAEGEARVAFVEDGSVREGGKGNVVPLLLADVEGRRERHEVGSLFQVEIDDADGQDPALEKSVIEGRGIDVFGVPLSVGDVLAAPVVNCAAEAIAL